MLTIVLSLVAGNALARPPEQLAPSVAARLPAGGLKVATLMDGHAVVWTIGPAGLGAPQPLAKATWYESAARPDGTLVVVGESEPRTVRWLKNGEVVREQPVDASTASWSKCRVRGSREPCEDEPGSVYVDAHDGVWLDHCRVEALGEAHNACSELEYWKVGDAAKPQRKRPTGLMMLAHTCTACDGEAAARTDFGQGLRTRPAASGWEILLDDEKLALVPGSEPHIFGGTLRAPQPHDASLPVEGMMIAAQDGFDTVIWRAGRNGLTKVRTIADADWWYHALTPNGTLVVAAIGDETTIHWLRGGALLRSETIIKSEVPWSDCVSRDTEQCDHEDDGDLYLDTRGDVWIDQCVLEQYDPGPHNECLKREWWRIGTPGPQKRKPRGLVPFDTDQAGFASTVPLTKMRAPAGMRVELEVRNNAAHDPESEEVAGGLLCTRDSMTLAWPPDGWVAPGRIYVVSSITWVHDDPPIFVASADVESWVSTSNTQLTPFVGCESAAVRWFGAGLWAQRDDDVWLVYRNRELLARVPSSGGLHVFASR